MAGVHCWRMALRVEKISAVTLRVANMRRSVRFYRDILGMEIVYAEEQGYYAAPLRSASTRSSHSFKQPFWDVESVLVLRAPVAEFSRENIRLDRELQLPDLHFELGSEGRSGPFGSQLLHEEFVESGVAAIGTRDVQTNRFEFKSGWCVRPEKFEELRRYQVFSGDILGTIVGASIGRFCVAPKNIPLAFTTKHIQALTLNPDIAEAQFVSYMLNFHRRCRESLFSQVEGSALPSLNAGKVLATALPLPALPEQRRVVANLDALQTKTNGLRTLQNETSTELNALMPSILDKAFRGGCKISLCHEEHHRRKKPFRQLFRRSGRWTFSPD